MKFFLVCALLCLVTARTLARASDRDVLQELEDLIDHKSNDDKQAKQEDDKLNIMLATLGKIAEHEHVEEKPLTEREELLLKALTAKLADEPEEKRGYNPYECKDRYKRCLFYKNSPKNYCYHSRFDKVMRRYCPKSCGFCECRKSKYGCCQDRETRAEGRMFKGCDLLLCYDRYASTQGICETYRKKGYCETEKAKMMVGCAQTCKYCTVPARAAAEPKCQDQGYGCCPNGQPALGPNKLGCPPCKDYGSGHICGKQWTVKDCDSKGIYTRLSMRRFCPRLCGYCKPS